MTQAAHPTHYSFEDYVAFERSSNVKHEHVAGQIYAMAGGTPEHAALAAVANGLLYAQLRGTPCRTYSSDLRVRIDDLTTYPDVTVLCGAVERDPADPNTVLNPKLVVEVTSASTEEYDRGEKLARYQQLQTLQAIVFVSHRDRRLTLLRRTGHGWIETSAGPGAELEIDVVGCVLRTDEVYNGLTVGLT